MPKIRPGVICWLYFLRWKIEKSFDSFKNDLHETKAWATGVTALKIQGYSICMLYNFIHTFCETLKKENECTDEKAEKKYVKNLKKRAEEATKKNCSIHPLLYISRFISKISRQFIRAFRNFFFTNEPLHCVLPRFIDRLKRYL